ncbi:MAG: YcxB family protein [Lachnospiraceae bacterium]|jgi:hypothetical protein|nr:YcxB family protein [Lachnospiraceae bacterium]
MDMEEKVMFKVKIEAKDLYRFFLVYNYRSVSGVLCVIASLASLVFLIGTFQHNESLTNGILFFIALYFTVFRLLTLRQKAELQVKTNPGFQDELEYEMNQEGIIIRQNGEEVCVSWEQVVRVLETKDLILVYTSRVNAFILPKEQFEASVSEVKEQIEKGVAKKKCRWKKVRI